MFEKDNGVYSGRGPMAGWAAARTAGALLEGPGELGAGICWRGVLVARVRVESGLGRSLLVGSARWGVKAGGGEGTRRGAATEACGGGVVSVAGVGSSFVFAIGSRSRVVKKSTRASTSTASTPITRCFLE